MTKILLVEDNPDNIDMLSRRLRKREYEVAIAMSGTEALEMARSERPDIVLMDMELPDIDGWEASRRLRADPETARLPIIAVTAHAMAEHRERSLEAGCDEFETKPIDFKALVEKIERLTQEKGLG